MSIAEQLSINPGWHNGSMSSEEIAESKRQEVERLFRLYVDERYDHLRLLIEHAYLTGVQIGAEIESRSAIAKLRELAGQ